MPWRVYTETRNFNCTLPVIYKICIFLPMITPHNNSKAIFRSLVMTIILHYQIMKTLKTLTKKLLYACLMSPRNFIWFLHFLRNSSIWWRVLTKARANTMIWWKRSKKIDRNSFKKLIKTLLTHNLFFCPPIHQLKF